ncbi:hypothetical protein Sjap_006640 [Stephania japonica]|uniref:Uncharacterized protein n=1 Tax=Stephania japonica TaxID=461633 RepID=A0AAP0PJY0_9MAGN
MILEPIIVGRCVDEYEKPPHLQVICHALENITLKISFPLDNGALTLMKIVIYFNGLCQIMTDVNARQRNDVNKVRS